jgi:hypothetical protein
LKKKNRKAVTHYIRYVANELGLRDWKFNFMYETTEEIQEDQSYAVVRLTRGRKVANIYLCREFRSLRPETQRHTIIHELLHCHFSQLQFFFDDLYGVMTAETTRHFDKMWRDLHEWALDGVTDGIENKFPIIDWKLTK